MTIQDIKKQQQEKYNTLLNECKVFWAFSNEQFAANKTPLQEGEKYVSIGAGGYMPKGSIDKYIQGSNEIKKWYSATIKATKNARRDNIVYELANHECYYTGDIKEAIAALGAGYTYKEVYKVYSETREQQTTQTA